MCLGDNICNICNGLGYYHESGQQCICQITNGYKKIGEAYREVSKAYFKYIGFNFLMAIEKMSITQVEVDK
jgi:hypothetical protein